MKLLFLSLILSLLIAAPALCETSVWVAKTDSSELYIGGTIHLLRKADKPLPQEFEKAYQASKTIVFETDITQLSTPETQQAIMTKAVYSDGRTLDSVLSEEAYLELSTYCTGKGIPIENMNKIKPSMVMITLMLMEAQILGVDQEGIDMFYHGKATTDKKPIEGLESIEVQIDMITSLGDGNESAYVLYSLKELHKMGEFFEKLVKAWKAGDIATLHELFIKEIKEDFPKVFKKAIVDRNMAWVPLIEEYIKSPETEFVMVGVGHLLGEEGVLDQLKKLGYKIEKLK